MTNTHGYDRESFLNEFYPDATDRAEVAAGADALVKISRAHALGGRMEIVADFGNERLVIG